jgi:amino acid adenylation domain-containing protein
LSKQDWLRFKKHAGQRGITPSNAILAAYASVLSYWSGSDHFILSHMAGQRFPMHPDINQVIGNFATLYPLEIDFRDGDAGKKLSFAERALRVQQQLLIDSQHMQYGGLNVMQALSRLNGTLGRSPSPFVVAGGLLLEDFKKPDYSCLETSQTLLDHQFVELDDGRYYFVWDVLEEFFPEQLIDSLWQAYKNWLYQLATDANSWQQAVPSFLPNIQEKVREHINQTCQLLEPQQLSAGLAQTAIDFADRSAVISQQQSMTYAELWEKSQQLAVYIKALKLPQVSTTNSCIAIAMQGNIHLPMAVHAVLLAGAAYVPVDPELPAERARYLLEHSQVNLIITDRSLEHWSLTQDIFVLNLQQQDLDQQVEVINSKEPLLLSNDWEALAYIIYTSGSTGKPKGVAIDHRGALNTILDINRKFSITYRDSILAVSSFSFDLSVYDLLGTGYTGATLIYPDSDQRLNPAHWLELMLKNGVSIWNSAPQLMQLLLDIAKRQNTQLPALRLVMLSGDWIPVELPHALKQVAPNAQLISLGGATEASIWSIYYPVDKVEDNWTSIPYGYPLANQSWHVLDAKLNPMPDWVIGDLYIGGLGLAIEYWRDEEKTQASFIIHPQTGERLYRTGDLGRYRCDGVLEFFGRSDFQVKVNGYRVELGEIESVLSAIDYIDEAVVLLQPLSFSESESQQLVAYIISSSHLDSNSLIKTLTSSLPDYMVPEHYISIDSLPLTPNGKLDRKALVQYGIEEFACQKNTTQHTTSSYQAPQNKIEQQLAVLWQQVLGIEEKISRCDDFFELGGQSLDAIRLTAYIKQSFSVSLSLARLWQTRNLRAMANDIETQLDNVGFKSLQTIRSTHPQQQSVQPWFIVHPAGGHIIGYNELSQHLSCPVFGFQAVGLTGDLNDDLFDKKAPLTSVEEMATLYTQEMLQQLNDLNQQQETSVRQPLSIAGWSSGGMIAFEICHQLIKKGHTVDSLVLIDSPAPLESESVTDQQLMNWFIEDLNLPGVELTSEEISDLLSLTDSFSKMDSLTQLNHALKILHQYQSLPDSLQSDTLLSTYRVFKAVIRAGRVYQPKILDLPIYLARATKGQVGEFVHHPNAYQSTWGWEELTQQSVYCQFFSASHHSILSSSNALSLAGFMNKSRQNKSRQSEAQTKASSKNILAI